MKSRLAREVDLLSFVLGLLPKKQGEEKEKDPTVSVEDRDKREEKDDDEDRPIVLKR